MSDMICRMKTLVKGSVVALMIVAGTVVSVEARGRSLFNEYEIHQNGEQIGRAHV